MLPDLGIDGAKLEMVESEQLLLVKKSPKLLQVLSIFLFCLGCFEIEVDVVDDSLQVVGRFLQVP